MRLQPVHFPRSLAPGSLATLGRFLRHPATVLQRLSHSPANLLVLLRSPRRQPLFHAVAHWRIDSPDDLQNINAPRLLELIEQAARFNVGLGKGAMGHDRTLQTLDLEIVSFQ